MSKLAVVILIVIIFLIFTVVVLFGVKSTSKTPKDTLSVTLDKNSTIKIHQDEDGAIRVEYTSFEERPSALEDYPDLLSDLDEQNDILDREFWEKYTHFMDCSLDEQRDMMNKLVSHGYVRYDDVHSFETEAPVDEDGNPVELPPDPTDEQAYRDFWSRPFDNE